MLMGIVVDGVAEVLNLAVGDIEDTPDFGNGTATPYLLGMAKVKGLARGVVDRRPFRCGSGSLSYFQS